MVKKTLIAIPIIIIAALTGCEPESAQDNTKPAVVVVPAPAPAPAPVTPVAPVAPVAPVTTINDNNSK